MQQVQKTLKQKITFSGIGVHSGQPSSVTVYPAPVDTGLVWCNAKDSSQQFRVGTVVPEIAPHATVIRVGNWAVSTVEHVMAALCMTGVDNARIELTGFEVPILDGSALPFVQGIHDVGLVDQGAPRSFLTPKQTLTFADDKGRELIIEPVHVRPEEAVGRFEGYERPTLSINYTADFAHPLAGTTTFVATQVTSEFFATELAPARTFGFLEQLPMLRQHGLARGSSLSNTVVISQERLNDLRFPDECVRHKVLDLIGDLALLGRPLAGSIRAIKTGHNFNRVVIEHFIKHPDLWLLI